MKRKTAYIGVFTAMAVVLGYVESLMPVFVGIPGIKLGLANMAVISLLYFVGFREAMLVSVIRVLIIGALFGNMYSTLYSMCGAVVSLLVMVLLKRTKKFSIYGVSVAGGVSHNLAQIAVAALITQMYRIWYYVPVLLISGIVTGLVIGLLGGLITKRLGGMIEI
jgi:heptaprenyl diphosphate synthase